MMPDSIEAKATNMIDFPNMILNIHTPITSIAIVISNA